MSAEVMSSRELAAHAARKMSDKGAEELLILELPLGRTLFDWVVIGNGRSERQVHTLGDEVYHFCKRHSVAHRGVEGEAGWRVLDAHDVVVHAFLPEMREFYDLESLWPDAKSHDPEDLFAEFPDPDLEQDT